MCVYWIQSELLYFLQRKHVFFLICTIICLSDYTIGVQIFWFYCHRIFSTKTYICIQSLQIIEYLSGTILCVVTGTPWSFIHRLFTYFIIFTLATGFPEMNHFRPTGFIHL